MCVVLGLKQRMVELVSTQIHRSYVCFFLDELSHLCQQSKHYVPFCSSLQTGREIPPLRENERVVRVFVGEGNFKVCLEMPRSKQMYTCVSLRQTLRIPAQCTVEDIVR